mmetsp:Transcript_8901/g.15711  ORF Transcript_8901/g.15711 Transcript_8901/m.15711 type:complete len:181 (-) Transcript_8901:72-614(-)
MAGYQEAVQNDISVESNLRGSDRLARALLPRLQLGGLVGLVVAAFVIGRVTAPPTSAASPAWLADVINKYETSGASEAGDACKMADQLCTACEHHKTEKVAQIQTSIAAAPKQEDPMRQHFEIFDMDESSDISPAELRANLDAPLDDLKSLLKSADKNDDDKLDYDEFKEWALKSGMVHA